MKNNCLLFFIIIFLTNLINFKSHSSEQFSFDITEIEIQNKGTLIKGLKRGIVSSNNGIELEADYFEYDKKSNVLSASGNIIIIDKIKDIKIYTDKVTYLKNTEKIISYKNSKAIYEEGRIIEADTFQYYKSKNLIEASGNVIATDKIKNYKIYTNKLSYSKDLGKINSFGPTKFIIDAKYEIDTENIAFLINEQKISSNFKTTIKDNNSNFYSLEKFNYQLSEEILKGQNIVVITNLDLPKSDKYYFSNAIIDFKNDHIVAKDTEVKFHKKIFDDNENDPRLFGVSSNKNKNITTVSKGIFTSCKQNENDKCPPWSIQAEKITHDKKKRKLEYKNAILRVYDFPVLYFPKFFHPDPSVKRQSGFLKPQLNNSNILGSSINLPYYKVLSKNKDLTFIPTLFENDLMMMENEYRQVNENSELFLNLGYVSNYKSSIDNKNKNIFSIFSKYNYDLNLDSFLSSDVNLVLNRITNDTYLKVFDQNIQESKIKPQDPNNLTSELSISLISENYNFNTGFAVYENLQLANSDRYQYILPYYNFEKGIFKDYFNGNLNFFSSGKNDLINTNNLQSTIINDLNYLGADFFTKNGIKSNIELNIKNLNSVGKNSTLYKSSPQVELLSMYSFNSSYPMVKNEEQHNNYFTPQISLKINPHDMKNYSNTKKNINTKNIFSNNRLGLSDSFEAGRSLTLGFDFKKESIKNSNKFTEISLATVLRDREEKFIPKNTSLDKKNSNIFGRIKTNFSELVDFEYNFAIDNNFKKLINNDISTTLSFNQLSSEFTFIKERDDVGSVNIFENSTSFKFNNENSLLFQTRRNREINLTEYYNLVYEYKNDCLTAGIKYKKTYYEDKDLKPSENLFFSITLIPLGTYEQKINDQ